MTTVSEIRTALAKVAKYIETDKYGENAWPIFDRLERELATRDTREARLAAAKERVGA